MKKLNVALFSSSLYVAAQLIANVLSTKIALLPILDLAIDGGTIIYPLTFTLRDFVHKTWGKKNARQLVIIAALLNLAMFFFFWLIGEMTPDPAWGNQEAYDVILLPVGRIVIASMIAQVISELIDTEIFSIVYKKMDDVWAVLFSNSVSLVVDSLIFGLVAFLGSLPIVTVVQIIISNILVKFIISLISIPTIRLVPRLVEHDEM